MRNDATGNNAMGNNATRNNATRKKRVAPVTFFSLFSVKYANFRAIDERARTKQNRGTCRRETEGSKQAQAIQIYSGDTKRLHNRKLPTGHFDFVKKVSRAISCV